MTYPIPDAALAQHTILLGKTRAGKSSAMRGAMERLLASATELQRRHEGALAALVGEPVVIPQIPAPAADTRPPPAGSSRKPDQPRPMPPRVARPASSSAGEASSPAGGGASLTGPQAHLLKGLAWWAKMGHAEPTRTMLAAKMGWRPGGSNLRGRLSELSTAALIEYPASGRVRLTAAGAAAAPAPDLATTLIDSIRQTLSGPQGLLFEVLLERGGTMARAELAEAVGWEPGGSNIRGRLSELSPLEIIEYPSRGEVRLQDWVTG